MRAKSYYSKKAAGRNKGRHHAPSPARTAGRLAGKAVPVLAVLGLLAAGPQLYKLATSEPASSAAHLASADMTFPVHAASARYAPLAVVRHDIDHEHGPAPAAHRKRKTHPKRHRTRHAASTHTSAPAPAPAQSSAPASSTPASSGHGAITCKGPVTGPVPQNYGAIVNFLTGHGYTGLAAAGIAGNIYRESMGNPESVGTGGGGLIGWTPLPAGMVTGNPTADLQTQLQALLTYNQQWSQYIPALNAATSATQASDIYMNDFERPGIPAASQREAAAQAVATACGL